MHGFLCYWLPSDSDRSYTFIPRTHMNKEAQGSTKFADLENNSQIQSKNATSPLSVPDYTPYLHSRFSARETLAAFPIALSLPRKTNSERSVLDHSSHNTMLRLLIKGIGLKCYIRAPGILSLNSLVYNYQNHLGAIYNLRTNSKHAELDSSFLKIPKWLTYTISLRNQTSYWVRTIKSPHLLLGSWFLP